MKLLLLRAARCSPAVAMVTVGKGNPTVEKVGKIFHLLLGATVGKSYLH